MNLKQILNSKLNNFSHKTNIWNVNKGQKASATVSVSLGRKKEVLVSEYLVKH